MSEVRLIDANALKDRLAKHQSILNFEWNYDNLIASIIDNAPTVEERPQGEWIITEELKGAGGIVYRTRKCNKCGWENSLVIPRNFCPNCGADMRGKEE